MADSAQPDLGRWDEFQRGRDVSFQRIGDPQPPSSAPRLRMARRLTLQTAGWFLALRDHSELGPFPSANAAMAASRALDARLAGTDAPTTDEVLRSFVEEQRRLLTR